MDKFAERIADRLRVQAAWQRESPVGEAFNDKDVALILDMQRANEELRKIAENLARSLESALELLTATKGGE